MLQSIFEIEKNTALSDNIFRMELKGNTSEIKRAGQFVNIKLDNMFLRRPISVCEVKKDVLVIIYKVVGKGTEYMSRLEKGAKLDVLSGLGNGYDESKAGEKPLLIGGGVGVPPLYQLAKNLIGKGRDVRVVLGFNTKSEVFYEDAFKRLGCDVTVATFDGSYGIKGFVTDALPEDYSYFYTCGPEPMLKAVYYKTKTSGQFSFESRMGCGFGACMGCSCKTITGSKRICKDGPVLEKEDIIWE